MSGEHKIGWLCEALLVSRSGYYDWLKRGEHPGRRARENTELRQRIRQAFAASDQTYGSPRIARELGGVSRKRVARLMRQERLWARQRSKFRVKTTDSNHGGPIAPNRLREITAVQPDQAWATDATAVLTGEGWLYLVAVLDLFSRRILGWAMHTGLDAKMATDALRMAITRRHPGPGLLVHSDRGSQFASGEFRQLLQAHGFVASMSRKGNCYDNAHMESFWSSLKYETVYRHRFATRAEARRVLFAYIEGFYNRTRLHSSLGYVSPTTFESQLTKTN
jgi:putative transposase